MKPSLSPLSMTTAPSSTRVLNCASSLASVSANETWPNLETTARGVGQHEREVGRDRACEARPMRSALLGIAGRKRVGDPMVRRQRAAALQLHRELPALVQRARPRRSVRRTRRTPPIRRVSSAASRQVTFSFSRSLDSVETTLAAVRAARSSACATTPGRRRCGVAAESTIEPGPVPAVEHVGQDRRRPDRRLDHRHHCRGQAQPGIG